MRTSFPGFPKEGMEFLRRLKKNNRREWFQPRKHVFEAMVKAPMMELVTAINAKLVRFAPDHVTDPGKALYRIYRDTRFSSDKTPYKTHIAANFWHQGMPKHASGGYYFSVSPDEIEIAGGVYMPGPPQLAAIRGRIAARHEEFSRLVRNRALCALMGDLKGDALSRVPQGFPPGHPAAASLKMKQWYYYLTALPVELATTPEFAGEVVKRFRIMHRVVDFFNAALAAEVGN